MKVINSQWATLSPDSPLLEALTRLSPEAQRAINLRFWENHTIEEIASKLRMSWEQTDQLIEKTLLELRELLEKLGAPAVIQEAS